MKWLSLALFVLGILSPQVVRAASPAPSSIAYLSLQRILSESADAQAAAKRLESMRQAKAQEMNAKKRALDATRLQLANAGGMFRASRRAQLRAEESRLEADLQRATQQAQTDLQNLQRQLQADLRRELNTIIADIAKRRSIQIVLNEDAAVVWAPAGGDLTTEVLGRLKAAAAQRSTAK